jgi:hypothetical protein
MGTGVHRGNVRRQTERPEKGLAEASWLFVVRHVSAYLEPHE